MSKKIYLVGIGMGADGTLTEKAGKIIEECDVLVGAKRMVQPFLQQAEEKGQKVFVSYMPKEIGSYFREQLLNNENQKQGAVLLSGDVGFYSGAKKLLEELKDFEVELVPGITSMVYFCSKIKCSWEDVCMASKHGKTVNAIQRIARYKKCFFLMDGEKGLKELCDKLIYYGMEEVKLYVGENLSYPEEKIYTGSPKEIRELSVGTLLVVLCENPVANDWAARAIPDEEFIRSKVPMTKAEVRTTSVGKLQLTPDAIVYDVGAGSGSVSVEIALQAPDIQVYAIEKKPDALQLLEQNKQKFAADNMVIIDGEAPEALEELPTPTHAFIGGSGGNLEEILQIIFSKNPACRVVINTIALNSIAKVMEILEKHEEYESEIVQMQTSVSKKVGSYQLMMGQNPIYIVSLWKKN